MADVITNLTGDLDAELEKARETLRGVDVNIKKLFGKEANELTFGQIRGRRNLSQTGEEDTYEQDEKRASGRDRESRVRRAVETGSDEPWEKRRRNQDTSSYTGRGGGFVGNALGGTRFKNRPNYDEDGQYGGGDLRGRLQSRIVTSVKEKSREEVLAEQREDRSGLTRNRRMFGALLGTLHRFKQDETKLKDKEERRAQIEAKLDEAAQNEREGVKKEKQQLIRDRKLKLTQIKRLEIKKNRLEELEEWETKTKYLSNFIRTDTKPHIFYLPKIINPVMDCKLEQSKQLVTEMIAEKRKKVLEELESYEQRSKRYWEQRLDGRDVRRMRVDPLDEDMEDELKEVMRTDEIGHLPEVDDHEAEAMDQDDTNQIKKVEEDEHHQDQTPETVKSENMEDQIELPESNIEETLDENNKVNSNESAASKEEENDDELNHTEEATVEVTVRFNGE